MPMSYQEINKKLQEIRDTHPVICEVLIDWNTMRLKDYEVLINRINKLEKKLESTNENT